MAFLLLLMANRNIIAVPVGEFSNETNESSGAEIGEESINKNGTQQKKTKKLGIRPNCMGPYGEQNFFMPNRIDCNRTMPIPKDAENFVKLVVRSTYVVKHKVWPAVATSHSRVRLLNLHRN
ncbi:hypothetical protein EVAR_47174_1 [Eumeta japonica]|uniref:Uncharacterized protein n=1 Tax=Eumeta variegata TaxID=151549 RepID=A0A4C1WVL5_EUMVA|nr:hypothetical protein EVAR_47174_1 [Eumeta japonica]